MVVAVAAREPGRRAPLDPHFGRCACFVLVDTRTREWRVLLNPAHRIAGEAGTRAAQLVVEQGAGVVVSGDFGPNAAAVLKSAGIRLCLASQGTIDEVVDDCLAGRLAELYTASWQTHPRVSRPSPGT